MAELAELGHQLEQALLRLDRVAARRIVMESANGFTPVQVVEHLLPPVLQRIGEAWDQGKVAMSQLYMGGRICEEIVDLVLPHGSPPSKTHARMAIAVLEDYHMLGKRIVHSVLRSSGFEVRDYGRMTAEELVERCTVDDVKYAFISTLMLPSALRVKAVRAGLDRAHPSTRIVVGGAPFRFDDHLWKEVGAYACGHNSGEAIEIAARLLQDRV